MKQFFKLSTAQQGCAYLLGALLLSGAIYYCGIQPAQDRIADLYEQGQERAQLVANVQALSQQEDYPQYVEEQQAQLELLQQQLPPQNRVEELVAAYYTWAQEEGVELTRLQLPPTEGKGKGALQLQAQGPYYALVNLLQRLEGEGSYCRLKQLKLQAQEGNKILLSAQLYPGGAEKIARKQAK